MVQIRKKTGLVQAFEAQKIIDAVKKSADRVSVEMSTEKNKRLIDLILEKIKDKEVIDVKDLHNIVEISLDEVDYRVAQSYRDYRNYKKEFSAIIDRVYNKKISLDSESDRSNANADSSLITTQKAIILSELNSLLYHKFFLNEEEKQAVNDGYIYIHDKGSRFDSINCSLFDMKSVLSGGFTMGNIEYTEPKSLDVAFDLIADVTLNAASSQYGGFTICEMDKLLSPYAELSYQKYKEEYKTILQDLNVPYDEDKADAYAYNKVKRIMEQGVQAFECKFNSVASSRGDYPFTSITFGLGTGRWETLFSTTCMKVRKEGQGNKIKTPVLFPKLSFFYDPDLHGEGKELEWLFDEAVDCSSKSMYPDFISLESGYPGDIYKKYHTPISRMGCRAQLSPWFIKGGMNPKDDTDIPVYVGRCNLGAITLHFPMIVAKAKEEGKDFFEVLQYYMDLVRGIHIKTFKYLSHKKAGTNPLAFCQGGLLNGYLDPEQELGEDFLRPMTMSFGIIALNEASVLQTGKSLSEDNSFALSIMQYVNDYITKYKKIDNILYAIYGVPGETLVSKQVQQFRKKYGVIKDVSDHEYTTNSFHCCVRDDITPIQKQDIEYPLYHLCSGGNIQYCRYTSQYNLDAIKTLVRRAMKMGFYEGVNHQLDFCPHCGERFIDLDDCPKCGSTDIIRIERVVGYIGYSKIKGRSFFNDGKMIEYSERVSM